MSMFDTLAESGVTQEDLEKAASARLFAEAAAAEGIDLSELSEDQAEELYDFWANGGEYAEKSASAEEMLAEAAVKEASAKLAEAEYIGRYMARVYADEMGKIAADDKTPGRFRSMGQGMRGEASDLADRASGMVGKGYNKAHGFVTGHLSGDKLKEHGRTLRAGVGYDDLKSGISALRKGGKDMTKAEMAAAYKSIGKGGLRAGLTAGAVGGAGYGAKKLYDRSHKKESSFDTVIEQRAMEILEALQAPSFDDAVDEAAIDLLRASGYDV